MSRIFLLLGEGLALMDRLGSSGGAHMIVI